MRSSIKTDITQYQFDALVSFAYNPAGAMARVSKAVNDGAASEAVKIMRSKVFSGKDKDGKPKRLNGLVARRDDEATLYLMGTYNHGGATIAE